MVSRITVRAEQVEDMTSRDMADYVLENVESYVHAATSELVSVEWEGPNDSRGRWVVVVDCYGVETDDPAALEMDAAGNLREAGDDARG